MTDIEKASYIEAELCLMARPAQAGITGAQNRWDELDWAHIAQSNVIHNVVRNPILIIKKCVFLLVYMLLIFRVAFAFRAESLIQE